VEVNVFQAAADHVKALQKDGKRVVLAAWTDGSAERLMGVTNGEGQCRGRKARQHRTRRWRGRRK
jgi:hypothetical protein